VLAALLVHRSDKEVNEQTVGTTLPFADFAFSLTNRSTGGTLS
jgi:hypothetical protein